MLNNSINDLLNESIDLLSETQYRVEKGHLLYDDDKFIGSFDNDKEKEELIKEYEEENNKNDD